MVLVLGMLLLSVLAPLILSSGSVPQLDVGEDLDDASKTRTFSVSLRPDPVAPTQPGLFDSRIPRHVPKERSEMRVSPRPSVVLPIEEQLTSTPQLSLHDRGQEPNGFRGLPGAVHVVDEQPDGQQVGFLCVSAFDLPTHIAPHHHVPTEELNVTSAIAGLVGHAGHLMSVVTNDP